MADNQYERERALLESYELEKDWLHLWGQFVDNKINEILHSGQFPKNRTQIFPLYRIKPDESVIRRIFFFPTKKNIDLDYPLKSLDDKVGTRIVVNSLAEVNLLARLIKGNNKFWSARISRNLQKRLKAPKEFDYQSVHITLTPKNTVPFFKDLNGSERSCYICEVQIRTLLQHAFAEIAHDTIYKGAYSIESELVRLLSRSMALMEVTDEHFEKAYKLMESEEIYEKVFINHLIKFSNENLGPEFSFEHKSVDSDLTTKLFADFQIRNFETQDVDKVLLAHAQDIRKASGYYKSYLASQPVIVLLIFLIYTNPYLLQEKWDFEECILSDLFLSLGFSYDRN
ncbi:MAG: hypothetical protein DHS20C18_44080 [Saprospiraceae bacterium]|nr:MAG: hypothetical protein DHS20C18_44080 [Saprospiraceae bacterium]